MLVTLKEVLRVAEERQIAIGAFNTPNLESLSAVLHASDELDLPVIVQFAQCHEELMPLDVIGPVMVSMAKQAKTPVCVHLDHGETFDYLKDALEMGFTSIMFDGSTLPYDENVSQTIKAVSLASRYGADVEAELGSMGVRETGAGDGSGAEDATKIYTDPALAEKFVAQTGVTALACSFGTTHGIYLTEPKLDFEVVRQVRKRTGGIPVVMHGGSGVSREDFHAAVQAGVRKINYFTYMDRAGGDAAEKCLRTRGVVPAYYSSVLLAAKQAMYENVKAAMTTFARMD